MTVLPLSGVKVVDLSRVLAGPLATMVLADLGADVIKVERPGRGDDTRGWGLEFAPGDTSYYYSVNRNKRSVTVDLASEQGMRTLQRLVRDAHVVVENFRAGTMERFGLGYEDLRAINPDLVYCAISGYDRGGPEASRPGYDLVVQGESGLMSVNGEAGRPPLKFGVSVVDLFTGMYAAQAVLAALYQRQGGGRGRRIDLALYDCGLMVSSYWGLEALLTSEEPQRWGNAHPSIVPYGVFEAADGPVVVAVGTSGQFRSLCERALGRPDLAADARFGSNFDRARNRDALLEILRAELRRHRRGDLLRALAEAQIPCGEVLGLHEALTADRTREGGLVTRCEHPLAGTVPVMAPPWRLDGERLPVRRPPLLGEHTAEILAGLAPAGADGGAP